MQKNTSKHDWKKLGHHLQIYSCSGDPQYTPKRPNSESSRAMRIRASLGLRVLAHDSTKHQQLPQHLSKEDTENVLARDHIQHKTPKSNKTKTHLPHPEKEKVGMTYVYRMNNDLPAKQDARRKQKKRQAENNDAANN